MSNRSFPIVEFWTLKQNLKQYLAGIRGHSLRKQLEGAAGRPSGFDYLRITLALSVAMVHIAYLTYPNYKHATIFGWPLPTSLILPMFFSLSGFLVAGSLERCQTLSAFVGLRIIRIFPALAVEILLSAFIVGPIFTNISPYEYFCSPKLLLYMLNITGQIHYYLPGVFADAPGDKAVNGQLWSVPFELECYILITVFALVGIKSNKVYSFLLTVLVIVGYPAIQSFRYDQSVQHIYISSGMQLVWAFLVGISLFRLRDYVPFNVLIFVATAILTCYGADGIGYWKYFLPFGITYSAIYLGSLNPPEILIIKGADYSYGVYLYHWVIQQAVLEVIPREWYFNAIFSLPLTVAFAVLSWHCVENPAMKLRKPLMRADKLGYGVPLFASRAFATTLLAFSAVYHFYLRI